MSHEEENLTPGERELEAALSRLTPSPPAFTLQQAQTRALIAAERRRTRIWQSVAAMLLIATGAALWIKPAPRLIEKVVIRDVQGPVQMPVVGTEQPSVSRVVLADGEFGYLRLRDKVLSRGVDSLRVSRELPASTPSPSIIGDPRTAGGGEVRTPWYVDFIISGGRS